MTTDPDHTSLGDAIRNRFDDSGLAGLLELAERADELESHWELARNNARLALDQRNDYRDNPRDEHHTMAELYEYRLLYHAHAANLWARHGTYFVAKSWNHSDGEPCFGGGWFIVTAHVGTGQVSNHYKADAWELFQVPEMDVAPQWDGHTPDVAAKRLRTALPPENRHE